MASIDFTDGTGSASLACSWPTPANRFRSYAPDVADKQDVAHGLGTGRRHVFTYADIYTAAIELPGILKSDLDIAVRLKKHLLAGGLVTLSSDDGNSTDYTDCALAEGSDVTLELEDRPNLEYVFRATFVSQDSPPVPLLFEYD